MVNWTATNEEFELIRKIVSRARALSESQFIDLNMDIEACHCNGCRLDLQGLLDADNISFLHDIYGINRHIDRSTGELMDCFTPRFAEREPSCTK